MGVLSRGRSCFVSGTGCGGPGVPRPHAVRGSGPPPKCVPPHRSRKSNQSKGLDPNGEGGIRLPGGGGRMPYKPPQAPQT